jgi:predicted RNase H-like HicB family nuclease
MTLDDYKLVLYRNQPDGWVAEVPSIPGCYALMATREAALRELEDVFQMIAAEYSDRGRPLPKDTTEILVGQSSGKSIAEALREFWRAHSVTMGKKDWTRDDLYDRWK